MYPDSSDFLHLLNQKFDDQCLLSCHPFSPLKTSLGEAVPEPGLVKNVRPAGFLTNRVAAAAMAICVANARLNFAHIGRAWGGRVRLQHIVSPLSFLPNL